MATREELKFQAEQDAHTLGEAEAIKSDRARMSRARPVASKLAAEAEQKAKGLRKVTKKSGGRKKVAKKTTRRR